MIGEHTLEEGEEAPPPGVRTMAVVRWFFLAAVIAAAGLSVYGYAAESLGRAAESAQRGVIYACPMHPQITSDRPGECPICHMSLEPRADQPPAEPPPASGSASAAPGETAPITLSLDRTQAIGVRTALVEKRAVAGSLRAAAAVEIPEQGRAEVRSRTSGFVEAVHVRDAGVKVRAGEVLASVYSPEVLQAQQELLTMASWGSGGALGSPADAARKKLELLGVDRATIDRVAASGKPVRAIGVSSPIAGYVIKKNVVVGSNVTPDKALFEIADLERVYVIASVYPADLAEVRVGSAARFTTPSLPGRSFESTVDLVYPEVDLASRTARVRLRVASHDLTLRPGQLGTVEIGRSGTEALTIPMDAVVDTGRSVYVFIAGEGGRFEARTVELGDQVEGRVIVRSGLAEGQRVVSGATFLIDAESRLRASLAATGPRGRP